MASGGGGIDQFDCLAKTTAKGRNKPRKTRKENRAKEEEGERSGSSRSLLQGTKIISQSQRWVAITHLPQAADRDTRKIRKANKGTVLKGLKGSNQWRLGFYGEIRERPGQREDRQQPSGRTPRTATSMKTRGVSLHRGSAGHEKKVWNVREHSLERCRNLKKKSHRRGMDREISYACVGEANREGDASPREKGSKDDSWRGSVSQRQQRGRVRRSEGKEGNPARPLTLHTLR